MSFNDLTKRFTNEDTLITDFGNQLKSTDEEE